MKALADLRLFVRAARSHSLSAAGRALDLTPAAASAAIKRLEEELDARLFVRSTRSLRLTQEGELFLVHCEQALQALDDAQASISPDRQLVRGVLQLSLPSDLGRNVVLPWLQSFREKFPQLDVRLQTSDRIAGIHREPVDVALRYGEPPDSSLVALPVAPANRRVLVAAPRYLSRHGTPQSPAELARHNCLRFMLSEQVHDRWRFGKAGKASTVAVKGSFVCDDGDIVRRLAVSGEGIAYKSWLDVADDVRAGRLVRLCPEWETEAAPLYLVCSHRKQVNPAVRHLREFLAQRCEKHSAS